MLELFALDDDLARWQEELAPLQGQARLPRLLQLAWHGRQRDPARARAQAREAAALLPALPDGARRRSEARCLLIDGEAAWLFGDLAAALTLADQACAVFDVQADLAGGADARWLRAWIAFDCGDAGASERDLEAAVALARQAGDGLRGDVFEAACALAAVFRDARTAEQRWGARFALGAEQLAAMHPAALGWINDYLGTAAFQASDFGRAIDALMRAFDAAMVSGQRRRAINLATNIGNGFTSLNAHHAALEWMQRGLDLARPTGWPMSIGLCQMQTAETLRQLGQREAAQSLLSEALATLAPVSGSRAYAVALEYQGDLALDGGHYQGALDSFAQLAARGEALEQTDFRSSALRGQAHALSQLARPQEALAMAGAALALAREHGDAISQIAALRVLAEIHARHQPAGADTAGAALAHLLQAMALGATIDGYTLPGDLLDALAREYAGAGDYARAYEVALRAGAAREQTHSQEATNRAIAMRVQYQTERAKTEGEHHRQLAAAEAQRAEVQRQVSATLEHLSAIGQEITTHLDMAAVFRALDRHVHGLLDATHFSILLIEDDGSALRCAFGTEAGRTLPATRLPLGDAHADAARCVRERREILIERERGQARDPLPAADPAAASTESGPPADGAAGASLLFVPLLIGARVLGVMTVQSLAPRAYGERERLIFRTLCAYGAIALDNASAYRQVAATLKALGATQAQLLDKNVELEQAYKALEDVSLTDQLTGLRNRRFFQQHVEADVGLSLRCYDDLLRRGALARESGQGQDLVFFMVDLDHFKQVNDRHGHAAGDAVLVQMKERLREVFRESDYLIRWGGEEFLVLARATHRDDARVVAERIRSAVADRDFLLADGTRLSKTCSIGFACFPFLQTQPRQLSWSEVVELADQGLYLAKRSGRNAWAAIYDTPASRPEGLFPRLIHQLEQAIADGDARLVTSIDQPALDAGAKPRRLLQPAERGASEPVDR